MSKFVSIFLLCGILAVGAEKCNEKFKEFEIIPKIIEDFESFMLNVTFLQPIECGVQLTPNEVRMMPDIDWEAKNDEFFTLLMVDYGAQDSEKMMEVNHWLVVNIPGNQIEKGETVVEFIGAMPPKGTGVHRYVFILFKQQKGKINNEEAFVPQKSIEGRIGVSTSKLIEKYDLKVAAGKFFLAEFDDFVPIIQEETFGRTF